MRGSKATRIVLFAGRDNEIPNGICSLPLSGLSSARQPNPDRGG